jgi:dTDP-4-dehydrorhamnose 3,5-epimerase
MGPSSFQVWLWDARPGSPTHGNKQVEVVGEQRPMLLIVPPGVVHAYKNVGSEPGLVFNAPNRLYRGPGKKEPVDEIRHEDQPDSPYQLD